MELSNPPKIAPAYTIFGFGEIGPEPDNAKSTTLIDGSVMAKLIAASSRFCNKRDINFP